MANSTTHRAQRVLIDFSSGPSTAAPAAPPCALARASPTAGWPRPLYGRAGIAELPQRQHEAGPTGAGEAAAVEPAPLLPKPSLRHPRWLLDADRHRFDYRPRRRTSALLRAPHQPTHRRVPVLRLTRQGDPCRTFNIETISVAGLPRRHRLAGGESPKITRIAEIERNSEQPPRDGQVHPDPPLLKKDLIAEVPLSTTVCRLVEDVICVPEGDIKTVVGGARSPRRGGLRST